MAGVASPSAPISYVGPRSVLFGAGEIHIGNQVAIGPDVVITSHGHYFEDTDAAILDQPTRFEPVDIEDDVYIGGQLVISTVYHREAAQWSAPALWSLAMCRPAPWFEACRRVLTERSGEIPEGNVRRELESSQTSGC